MAERGAGAAGSMKFLSEPAAELRCVSLHYKSLSALDNVSVSFPAGKMAGLIGPDGIGKSSLLSLIAGARAIQSGEVLVLGGDLANENHRRNICPRIAYMPQGLGKNLYPDLSVRENLEFFGRLFDQSQNERDQRIDLLLAATGLDPFPDRLVSQLSGGMRQKLGLCCSLIHDPDLLILDEPTTGVDPLSRRQFWSLISRMRAERPGMSIIVATAYMEEAEQFDWLVAMDEGHILATGSLQDFKQRTGGTNLEKSFISLLPEDKRLGYKAFSMTALTDGDREPVIVAHNLTRRFGSFVAVDDVTFSIKRGEIFGFLGSNGCGKTTTMKLLTGLLVPSGGEVLLFGKPVKAADMQARFRVGYMSQSFSLYTELTVQQNLDLYARLFHLGENAKSRIDSLVSRFGLEPYLSQPANNLPLGIRQRLSLAVAVIHKPELLILDEPTSGVDPLARDQFWELLAELSRDGGMTVFISTHFMNEAERCDRIALMNAGRVLALGKPASLKAARGSVNLEEAFISYLEEANPGRDSETAFTALKPAPTPSQQVSAQRTLFSFRRLFAYTIRETLELMRDPIRMGFALLGTAFLMMVFGVGISTDVNNLSFAVLDRDNSHESRSYLEELRGSTYFIEKPPLIDQADLERRLQSGDIKAAIEIPPDFGRYIKKGVPVEVGAWVDGAMPFRAETIRGYLTAAHQQFLTDQNIREGRISSHRADSAKEALLNKSLALADAKNSDANLQGRIETRFLYNQNFESIYAQVPGSLALLLVEIPAILMALAIVREKELGSITNLYVTPVTRIEFLLGKQIPYIGIAMINFALMCLMGVFVFGVPIRGSISFLIVAALVYVTATTGIGMLISAFCQTQIAALFGTAILTLLPATTFSGMLSPVSSMTGAPALLGHAFPMTYFLKISVGTFTKGLGFQDLSLALIQTAAFIPILTGLSLLFLRKQER